LVPAGPPVQNLTGYQVWPASVVQSIWPRLPVPGFPARLTAREWKRDPASLHFHT
jgi:hypothetical protein